MCYYGENCTRCVFFLIRLLPSPRHEKLRSAAIYKNLDIRAFEQSSFEVYTTIFAWYFQVCNEQALKLRRMKKLHPTKLRQRMYRIILCSCDAVKQCAKINSTTKQQINTSMKNEKQVFLDSNPSLWRDEQQLCVCWVAFVCCDV